MAKRVKVFIDSNVWFSAFYKKGVCSQLLENLNNKKFEVVISRFVLEEIVINIKNKLPSVLSLVYNFFQEYTVTVVKNPTIDELKNYLSLADKKDLPILVSALNYKCNYFITGNIKDFEAEKIKKKYGLRILIPKKALKIDEQYKN